MASETSRTRSRTPLAGSTSNGLKLAVAGGFGAGKTTLVETISEIPPVSTDVEMTQASVGVDNATPDKTHTTVGIDFGRITLDADKVLYLFGAPGQERFAFLWPELFRGALGAVVLADTRFLERSFASVARVENSHLPFVVAHNVFGNEGRFHSLEDVRSALEVQPHVPVVACDARDRSSVKSVLVRVVEHSLDLTLRRAAGLEAAR